MGPSLSFREVRAANNRPPPFISHCHPMGRLSRPGRERSVSPPTATLQGCHIHALRCCGIPSFTLCQLILSSRQRMLPLCTCQRSEASTGPSIRQSLDLSGEGHPFRSRGQVCPPAAPLLPMSHCPAPADSTTQGQLMVTHTY